MPTLVSTGVAQERGLLTAEEFLDWLEPKRHADLLAGEVFMHSPVNFRHARLLNFMDRLLGQWIERSGAGGELHREVVAVRLDVRHVLLPDLAWFDAGQVRRFAPAHAPVAPRWVAEALSPGSAERDTGQKFAAYEAAGVEEYWILDPDTLRHRFYARPEPGAESLEEFAVGEAWIASRVLRGFGVERAWLDPEHPPALAACLERLAGPG